MMQDDGDATHSFSYHRNRSIIDTGALLVAEKAKEMFQLPPEQIYH